MSEAMHTLESMLSEFDHALLVTVGEQRLHARPMVIVHRSPPATLYFISEANAPKMHELERDARAAVTLQSPKIFIALSGRADLAEAPEVKAHIQQSWELDWTSWTGLQPDSPNLRIVRFEPDTAEYWDFSGLKLLRFMMDTLTGPASKHPVGFDEPDQHALLHIEGKRSVDGQAGLTPKSSHH